MSDSKDPPGDVVAIRRQLVHAFNVTDTLGRCVGDCKHGVYAFFDYDGEPIYVGQTRESLRVRIRRHLTNQRTDAVSMSVLDPFEVAEIEMWPFWDLDGVDSEEIKQQLSQGEYTIFQQLLKDSAFGAVLNEKPPPVTQLIRMPLSVRQRIVPDDIYERRLHPDIRIAQRAATIARLADIISRRSVQPGLRATLLTQAKRLQHLAERRLNEVE